MINYLPCDKPSSDAKRDKIYGADSTDRARENAQHDQEHTASRDYDKQRNGGKS
jgi:hypothetical protein